MKTLALLLPTAGALLCAGAQAQSTPGGTGAATLLFSTDFVELANSGMGSTTTTPGNQAATFDDEEVLMVAPQSGTNYFAVPNFTLASVQAWFGDNDGDGIYTDNIVNAIDAIYVPPGAPNPPSIFDIYVSFEYYTQAQGVLTAGGAAIQDGDVVRLLPGGGFVPFITEDFIRQSMNTTNFSVDVNAFCVDQATGDIYWSMNIDEDVNGVTVNDGGIVRLAAANYTANADGTVASVVIGGAEIVMHESEVDVLFTNVGLNNAFDIGGLEIDPNGGAFVSTSTGATLPNLWMVDLQSANGTTILSTANGAGAFATEGGVTLGDGPAMGLSPTGWSELASRNLSALARIPSSLTATPAVLDTFPTGLSTVAATSMVLDLGGFVPNSQALVLANLAEGSLPGGFTNRTPLLPTLPYLAVPGSFGELYTDNPGDLLFGAIALPVPLDAQGYGTLTVPIPALPPGIAVSFQAVDLTTLAVSTPVILITL
jgi:hypothetical protein